VEGTGNERVSGTKVRLIIIIVTIMLSWAFTLTSAVDTVGMFSFFGTALASAVLAFGLLASRSPLVCFGAVGAFGSMLLITQNLALSLSAVMYLPVSFVLVLLTMRSARRSETVVSMSVVLFAEVMLFALVSLGLTSEISYDSIIKYFESMFDPVRGVLENSSLYNAEGEIVYLYTAEQVDAVISYMMRFMPAILICAINAYTYFISSVYHALVRRANAIRRVNGRETADWKLRLSPVSAVVFIVSYLITVLFGGSMTALEAAALNLVVILVPGFAMIGARTVIAKLKKRGEGSISPFVIIAAIILICINISVCFIILAFFGVVTTLIAAFSVKEPTE